MEIIPESAYLSGIEFTFAQCDNATGLVEIVVEDKESGEVKFSGRISLDEIQDKIVAPFILMDCKVNRNQRYVVKITPIDITGEPLLFLEEIPVYYKKCDIHLLEKNVLRWKEQHTWYGKNDAIAHALGGIDGAGSVNCLEGFKTAYENGFRVFETDFVLTEDGYVVLRHDWEMSLGQEGLGSGVIPTKEEFLSKRMNGKYTPLGLEDLIGLMAEYPDIYVVTDIKNDEELIEILEQIVAESQQFKDTENILNRIIVQIYNPEQYDDVQEVYAFSDVILTLYRTEEINFEDIGMFCTQHGIDVVVMPNSTINQQKYDILHGYGLRIYGHTYNDVEMVESQKMWIDGYYTDFLMPNLLRQ